MNAFACRLMRATAADAGEILTLQRAAYQSEALLYGDPRLPPLVQTLDDLRAELNATTCLKAMVGPRIVGAIRGRLRGETAEIRRLVVAPDMQGLGIGTRLLKELEERLHPPATRFELFTGDASVRNLRLYERLGYREFARRPMGNGIVLVYMEKGSGTSEEAAPS